MPIDSELLEKIARPPTPIDVAPLAGSGGAWSLPGSISDGSPQPSVPHSEGAMRDSTRAKLENLRRRRLEPRPRPRCEAREKALALLATSSNEKLQQRAAKLAERHDVDLAALTVPRPLAGREAPAPAATAPAATAPAAATPVTQGPTCPG